jgi:outer membrane protein OmpA-like peptidoglycan-associated protein
MVERTTKAIQYNHRGESTKIDFRGTSLLPEGRGEASVESRQGAVKIDAHMKGLWPAIKFGPEYLTYVMWAIAPGGGATNLGELLMDRDKAKLDATTELQSFGLIVTAEPYFAVTRPSDVVVMESFIRKDTAGTVEQVDVKYDLLQRGQYTLNADPAEIQPLRLSSKVPLEIYEARNAVQIARWTGAARYAPDTFQKAVQDLQNAEGYLTGKAGTQPIGTVAREAVQMAEDARITTVKKIDEERLARAGAPANTARATEEADTAQLVALSGAGPAKRDDQTRMTEARNETDRLKSENATIAAAKAEAGRLKRGTAKLDRGIQDTAQAEPEKAELRSQLLTQFNAILQTRDTARGLIVNMSDVLFDTDQYSLLPVAREKLAKVAGIVSGHPGLRLDVEGYTDSVGGDEYNQRLSEQRGSSVRDYLILQGMLTGSVTTKGFGKAGPVASNDTAQGRQQNRRVELVISGEIIGTEIGTPIAAR